MNSFNNLKTSPEAAKYLHYHVKQDAIIIMLTIYKLFL